MFIISCSADVYLKASESPSHLFSFDNISQALEQGATVTFSAMVFLCGGGKEFSFAVIGGKITSKSHVKTVFGVSDQVLHKAVQPKNVLFAFMQNLVCS